VPLGLQGVAEKLSEIRVVVEGGDAEAWRDVW
jgi:hypothetical protein